MIPDYQSLMKPLLRVARNGEVRIGDAVEKLAVELKLSRADRTKLVPNTNQTIFANRVHWAKTYLKQAGLLELPRRGYFTLTGRGRAALEDGEAINNAYLRQFEDFERFKSRSTGKRRRRKAAPG